MTNFTATLVHDDNDDDTMMIGSEFIFTDNIDCPLS